MGLQGVVGSEVVNLWSTRGYGLDYRLKMRFCIVYTLSSHILIAGKDKEWICKCIMSPVTRHCVRID